ncbi:uncharacterized protein [Maniola hyperantus]|uniref:uncharacterized protein n=1 Tax=Aphantopus hyperantus TaxID=2795564 RepID=UPI003748AF33
MGRPPKPVVLASIYMPIEDGIPTKELVELVTYCEDNDMDLIISVDSNAHHNLWGCTANNKRGVTDSPLCRACMEVDETPTHVLLECTGVADQRERHLGSPTSLHEALGNLGGLFGFWSELGWLE